MSDKLEHSVLREPRMEYGKVNSYKDLVVWQNSIELVSQIYSLTQSMPEGERFGLTSQIRRASVSVASNIAEGWGIQVTGNYLHHLKISFGSLCEVETQLILIENLNLLNHQDTSSAKSNLVEVSKMLRSLIKSLEQY